MIDNLDISFFAGMGAYALIVEGVKVVRHIIVKYKTKESNIRLR